MNASLPCLNLSPLPRLAEALRFGLQAELDLTPKPGLVDRWDNGSHEDLNYALMARSIALLDVYFYKCVSALQAGCSIERLRHLGVQAEQRMFAQVGANSHRGAIFLGGLLLGAMHFAASLENSDVSDAVAACAAQLFASRMPEGTKGRRVRARYQVGGIIREALDGFPSVFGIAVPALREGAGLGLDERRRLFLAMARLMVAVEDTTTLRRGGRAGLAQVRRDGARLEKLLLSGADPTAFLSRANERYREQRLTMGGIADLLGLAVAWSGFKADSTRLCPHNAAVWCE